jgi:hypothetical protein
MTAEAKAARLEFNTDTVLRLVCSTKQLAKMERA